MPAVLISDESYPEEGGPNGRADAIEEGATRARVLQVGMSGEEAGRGRMIDGLRSLCISGRKGEAGGDGGAAMSSTEREFPQHARLRNALLVPICQLT